MLLNDSCPHFAVTENTITDRPTTNSTTTTSAATTITTPSSMWLLQPLRI